MMTKKKMILFRRIFIGDGSRFFFVFFLVARALPVFGLPSVSVTEISKEGLFSEAKRFVFKHYVKTQENVPLIIKLMDDSVGLARFVYHDGQFKEEATIEVISLDTHRSKIRVSIANDYRKRDSLLLEDIVVTAKKNFSEKCNHELSYDAQKVYESVKRYVIKNFSSFGQNVKKGILLDVADIKLLRFVYQEDTLIEPDAEVDVLSISETKSCLVVSLPSASIALTNVLAKKMIRQINEDLSQPATLK